MPYTPPTSLPIELPLTPPATFTPSFSGSTIELTFEDALPNTISSVSVGSAGSFGAMSIRLQRQYVYLSGINQNAFGAAVLDNPPIALELAFQPPTTYSPPAGTIELAFQEAVAGSLTFVTAGDQSSFGSATVFLKTRYVLPAAFNASGFGIATVRGTQFIAPQSIEAPLLASPTVALKTRYVTPVGLNAFKGFGFGGDGDGFVDFAIRRRYPVGFVATQFGTAFLSGGVRWIDGSGWGLEATTFGTAFVAYKERIVQPAFFVATVFGTAQIGFHRNIYPSGFDASVFGTGEVFDNRKRAFPPGFDASSFGDAMVAPRVRIVYPDPFWSRLPGQIPETRWGRPEVYNKRQYIEQYFEVTPYDGGTFGTIGNYVENRNKTIQTYGHRDSKFPLTHKVELTGVALTARGFNACNFGSTLIAYRIRNVYPSGEDVSFFAQWNQVRNTAQIVRPTGRDVSNFGLASTANTRRYYANIAVGGTLQVGTPFVAFRVRTITPYYSYEGGEVKEPIVQFLSRRLYPPGIAPKEVGAHTVEEHFNIIAPRWTHVDRMGTEGTIRNVTPEIRPDAYVQTLWGATRIFNRWNYCPVQGFSATLWGRNVIEYRTKTVIAGGLAATRWGPTTNIRNLTPDPPGPQTIAPLGWVTDSTPFPSSLFVRSNVLFQINVGAQTRYGVPTVVRMGIGPAGGIRLIDQFGTPSLNATQYINPDGIEHDDAAFTGRPRFSPYTIWASTLTPAQAIANHPGPTYHLIDRDIAGLTDARPTFGLATISNGNRRLLHAHGTQQSGDQTVGERFGDVTISNRVRTIYPTGFKSFKYGIPLLNGGGEMTTRGLDMSEFGDAEVTHFDAPFSTKRVYPSGWDMFDYGQPVVSNFIHNVNPNGINAIAFGTARLHPPEPVIPQGWRSDIYGTTDVSHRIRNVYPTGIEPLEITSSIGSFADRMKVKKRFFLHAPSVQSGERFGTPAFHA